MDAASTALEAFSSSSPSNSSKHWKYDVFLSFRGEDTRKNFTDHLYCTLKDNRVNAYIDEKELPRGENISEELKQAIEQSRISVIVFSKRYADSTWCLEELEKIMECRSRGLGQMVLPIFYDVDPTHVRKQTGSFAEAFKTHEANFPEDNDKIKRWRSALFEAANLAGGNLKNIDGYEGKFVEKIVAEITRKLNNTCLHVATNPIGIDSHVKEVSNYLRVGGSDHDVRIIGILGMGGTGKTTIAKVIFNEFEQSFQEIGIGELHDRCLVSVDEGNNLIMHDLLRDMGREIVREKSPDITGKRSRLWDPEDVKEVLRSKSGTEKIEGLTLDLQESQQDSFSAEALEGMQGLRLLKLKDVNFKGPCKHLSKKLSLLCWPECPLKSMPQDFIQRNMVDIDLSRSRIEVWKDSDVALEKLKFLNLGGCNRLKRFPDFSKLPNLKKLILQDCKNLSKIFHSIVQLKNLEYLYLADCKLADRAIPEDLGGLSSLRVLDLRGNAFKRLPTLSHLSKLQTLQLSNCSKLLAIPDLPTNLEILQADECIALEKMPNFSEMLRMRELHLNHSPKLTEIIGLEKSLYSMTRIHMEGCTNLTAAFKEAIIQGWSANGNGGPFLPGNDFPSLLRRVNPKVEITSCLPFPKFVL